MKSPNKPFKFSDYIFTPRDIVRGIGFLFNRTGILDYLGILLMGVLATLLYLLFPENVEEIVFGVIIYIVFFWNMDSRAPIGAALVGLVCIPILLILFNNDIYLLGEYWAERVAVWVYYLLVIGVAKQITEYIRENRQSKSKCTKKPSFTKPTPPPSTRVVSDITRKQRLDSIN